jgi:hypothetical protein
MRGAGGRSSSRRPPRRDWQQQSRASSSSSKDDALVDLDDPTVKLWARLAVYALVFVAPGYALCDFFSNPFFAVSLCLLSLYLSSRRLISLSFSVCLILHRLLLFALPSIRLGGNFVHDPSPSSYRGEHHQQPRKALEQQQQQQQQQHWWQHHQHHEDDEQAIDAIVDDLDVDALFELEEVKPHEMVEEHQTSSRGDKEHARAPSMEGDDEEEEREAFEATEGGGGSNRKSSGSSSSKRGDNASDDETNIAENKDAIGAGGEEEEDKLENLDMSLKEKEEHENAIREAEENTASGSNSYGDNEDSLDAISAESTASQARIKKLKQLIKPKKMRVFLSLKAINPGCRYLSEGLGTVERSDVQGTGYGKLVVDPSQLNGGSANGGLGVTVQQQKQTIIYDANGEPMTKKPSGASVAKEIASNAGSGGLR